MMGITATFCNFAMLQPFLQEFLVFLLLFRKEAIALPKAIKKRTAFIILISADLHSVAHC